MLYSVEEEVTLSSKQFSVYSCLCYFSIFKYPLRKEQVAEFCDTLMSPEDLSAALDELCQAGLLFNSGDYYCTEQGIEEQIRKRKSSEDLFFRKVRTIRRFAALISRFPYVRFVGISGSCSKGLLDNDGDVDYFIITEPGRLWLCRTLLVLFKKVCLLNSKKYFCVNYFIDSDSLEIRDRNVFVAHELKTLAPVNNYDLYRKFMVANSWADKLLPNKDQPSHLFLDTRPSGGWFTSLLEKLLNNAVGNFLEARCFSLTVNTWRKRFGNLKPEDFEINFRSRRNISKHHPRGFQKRVMQELEKRLYHVRVVA